MTVIEKMILKRVYFKQKKNKKKEITYSCLLYKGNDFVKKILQILCLIILFRIVFLFFFPFFLSLKRNIFQLLEMGVTVSDLF